MDFGMLIFFVLWLTAQILIVVVVYMEIRFARIEACEMYNNTCAIYDDIYNLLATEIIHGKHAVMEEEPDDQGKILKFEP